MKKDVKDESQKLSTGTRQLKAHELTYFGVKSSTTRNTTESNSTHNSTNSNNNQSKSPFMHLSSATNHSALISKTSHNKTINLTTNTSSPSSTVTPHSSKVIINQHQKPDLIMHHQQKYQPSTPELSSSEKKTMMETLDSCIDETKNLEPLYENLYQSTKSQLNYDRKLDLERDEQILDELTRAADEIMNVSLVFIFKLSSPSLLLLYLLFVTCV
jgi:hypothetical protein